MINEIEYVLCCTCPIVCGTSGYVVKTYIVSPGLPLSDSASWVNDQVSRLAAGSMLLGLSI